MRDSDKLRDKGHPLNHPFEAGEGSSGMVCTHMVERDGGGDACGGAPDQHRQVTPLPDDPAARRQELFKRYGPLPVEEQIKTLKTNQKQAEENLAFRGATPDDMIDKRYGPLPVEEQIDNLKANQKQAKENQPVILDAEQSVRMLAVQMAANVLDGTARANVMQGKPQVKVADIIALATFVLDGADEDATIVPPSAAHEEALAEKVREHQNSITPDWKGLLEAARKVTGPERFDRVLATNVQRGDVIIPNGSWRGLQDERLVQVLEVHTYPKMRQVEFMLQRLDGGRLPGTVAMSMDLHIARLRKE